MFISTMRTLGKSKSSHKDSAVHMPVRSYHSLAGIKSAVPGAGLSYVQPGWSYVRPEMEEKFTKIHSRIMRRKGVMAV